MKRLAAVLSLALLAACVNAVSRQPSPALPPSRPPTPSPNPQPVPPLSAKKLVQVGWDAPNPDFVRANIARMEERPFDGLMIKLRVSDTGNVFMPAQLPPEAFAENPRHSASVKPCRNNTVPVGVIRKMCGH